MTMIRLSVDGNNYLLSSEKNLTREDRLTIECVADEIAYEVEENETEDKNLEDLFLERVNEKTDLSLNYTKLDMEISF